MNIDTALALPDLPKQLTQIMDKLCEHGYTAYIHGECVRGLIKGHTPLDFDLMTDAELARVRVIFENHHIIKDNLQSGELIVTVLGVAARITSYANLGTLSAGLANEHAFTLDAIAYSTKKGFDDPFKGMDDLKNNSLNFVLTGNKFNTADIFPALACGSNGEFTISEGAKQLIKDSFAKSPDTPCVRADFEAIIMGKKAGEILREYSFIIESAIPELKMINFDGGEPSGFNLLNHSYKAIGSSSPILTLRYALLFHELGKPDCHSKSPDGTDSYLGQYERGGIYASRIMTRFGCDPEDIKETVLIIKNYSKAVHADEHNLKDMRDDLPSGLLKLLLLFNCADYRAAPDEKTQKISMKFKKLATLL